MQSYKFREESTTMSKAAGFCHCFEAGIGEEGVVTVFRLASKKSNGIFLTNYNAGITELCF